LYIPPADVGIGALVVTKVDYCSSTLAGVSSALLQCLHSVLNAAT